MRADADAGEQPRVVPRHHLRQPPHAQLPERAHLHAMPPPLARPARLPVPPARTPVWQKRDARLMASGRVRDLGWHAAESQHRTSLANGNRAALNVRARFAPRVASVQGRGVRRAGAPCGRGCVPSCAGPTCGAARCRCETRRAVVLEAADGALSGRKASTSPKLAADPEIDGVAGEVVGARRPADPRVVAGGCGRWSSPSAGRTRRPR